MIRPYNVACVQTNIAVVNDPSEKEKIVSENLNRSLELANEAVARNHASLIVFPEFWLQGFGYDRSIEDWEKICLTIPGDETDLLGRKAKELGVYMCGAVFEVDPDWPGRYFNTAFIISDEGKVILKYRKINCGNVGGIINDTTPGDVYTEYVKKYGMEALFPVVDTPYGKLGCLICFDINFPENARCVALNGAEVILYPTGEPHGAHRDAWECARRTRAYENNVYLCMANHGSVSNTGMPNFRSHGWSEIVNYEGRVLAVADGQGEAIISARLDLNASRYHRSQPGLNFLPQVRTQLYGPIYASKEACPNDHWLENPMQDRREGPALMKQVIEKFYEKGIFVPYE